MGVLHEREVQCGRGFFFFVMVHNRFIAMIFSNIFVHCRLRQVSITQASWMRFRCKQTVTIHWVFTLWMLVYTNDIEAYWMKTHLQVNRYIHLDSSLSGRNSKRFHAFYKLIHTIVRLSGLFHTDLYIIHRIKQSDKVKFIEEKVHLGNLHVSN